MGMFFGALGYMEKRRLIEEARRTKAIARQRRADAKVIELTAEEVNAVEDVPALPAPHKE